MTRTGSITGAEERALEIRTPEEFQAWLDMLITSGVEEFEGFGFHVRFTPSLFTKDKMVPSPEPGEVLAREPEEEPDSIWRVPSLWPGGKPPEFPR